MVEMKTSAPSWFNKAAAALSTARTRSKSGQGPLKVAILGVGSELNGDDGAGILAARCLSEKVYGNPDFLLVEGGSAPENFSGVIRRFEPDILILLDAAWMDAEPGTIGWFEMHEIDGVTATTHGLPLSLLAGYLAGETGCLTGALFIQPESMDFGSPLTERVERGVQELVEGLTALLL